MEPAAAVGPIRGVEPPRQARSRRTYHRLLEAASELLADRPFDEVTVDEIADRAGYTKGAFYARFESKGALLRHLVARLTDGAQEAWGEFLDPVRWEGRPVGEIVESFLRRMVAIYARSGHVMRVVDREVRLGGDEHVRATMERLNAGVAAGFIRLLQSRRDQLPSRVQHDVHGACEYWLMALAAVLRAGFLDAPGRSGADDLDQVADRTSRLMVPYLTSGA